MSNFRADCSNCCGLCCIVPDQLATQGFPYDKPANTPCHRLDACNRCSIHARREEYGYGACKGYDCFGVGQWVTQELSAGASWRDSPEMADHMFAAYRYWAPRFEAAALLEAALPRVREDAKHLIAQRIHSLTTVGSVEFEMPDAARLLRETIAMIRSLL
jgi:hypothetical protein